MDEIKITAIVCSYNEERTVSEVVQILIEMSIIDELIVVDDGSTDRTKILLRKFQHNPKFHLIINQSNMGKGYAMAEGIENANNELLLFVDADLKNFSFKHIKDIIHPIMYKGIDMVIGHPTDTLLGHQYNPFKLFSGQRVLYKKDIYPLLEKMRVSRFGVETLINLHFKANRKTIILIPLVNLNHPIKTQKYSLYKATLEFLKEILQISQTILVNNKLLYIYVSNTLRR